LPERLEGCSLQPAAVNETAFREPFGLESAFLEHQRRVFRAAFRITGNAQDAEDVLQTVLLRLARQGEGVLAVANPSSYLYRAAINAALDLLRARRERPSARAPKADWPPLRVLRFSGRALTAGVEEHRIEGQVVRVYSLPKTICDCFKYRNKLGLDVALGRGARSPQGRLEPSSDPDGRPRRVRTRVQG